MNEQKPEAANEAASAQSALNVRLATAIAALKRIAECEDAPDIDATGDYQFGLHCGVEDRNCQDRYQGADYGHTVGVEKALEWASNEAKYALEQVANALREPHADNETKETSK